MARLDRRQRSALGRARTPKPRLARLPEDASRRIPRCPHSRDNRWNELGLVNEPCFTKADGTRSEPVRALARRARSRVPARPVRATTGKYHTGVAGSARAGQHACRSAPTTASPPASSACVCFPNPDFDEEAQEGWDSERYYRDPTLLRSARPGPAVPGRHVVRVLPRRAQSGEAAGRSRESAWANLSLERRRAVLLVGPRLRLEGHAPTRRSFLNQALHTSLPGTLDTSLVSTDNINNPRTMNAVYYLGPRMGLAKRFGQGDLAGGELDNQQFNDFFPPTIRSRSSSQRRPRPGRRAC